MKSCLLVQLYGFNCVSFEKSYAVNELRLRWEIDGAIFFLLLVFLSLYSAQYPHDILEEQIYIATLITNYKLFQSNDSKKTGF